MGYPCHLCTSSPCLLMEDGGCLRRNDIRFRCHPCLTVISIPQKLGLGWCGTSLETPFGALPLSLSQASRLWASFPMYFSERKGCGRLFCREQYPFGYPTRNHFYSLPYGLGHPFHIGYKGKQNR